MKRWLVWPSADDDTELWDHAIIIAETEAEARAIYPVDPAPPGWPDDPEWVDPWKRPSDLLTECQGEADGPPRVISVRF